MKYLVQHVTKLTKVIDINTWIVLPDTHIDDILSPVWDEPEFPVFSWH
jgi:hypothetical protein